MVYFISNLGGISLNNKQNRKINLISNRNFLSRKTSETLKSSLRKKGFTVTEKYDPQAELNITVGGDGAFLRAVHRNNFPDIPFIGINTGHLGFFQEVSPKRVNHFVEQYILGNYTIEEMSLMETEIITHNNRKFHIKSVNEIFVKTMNSKVIHLNLYIDGNHLERFSGDGLIISTPWGSTGYGYSAAGAIVHPSLDTLQITPLAPIISKAFRSLPNSVIVPGDLVVSTRPEERHKNSTIIVNDGQEFFYKNIKYINTRISKEKIYKLTLSKDSYWDNLKDKFL